MMYLSRYSIWVDIVFKWVFLCYIWAYCEVGKSFDILYLNESFVY